MAKKVKLTRPELKRHRDALGRFERYLPMLKLKQQQLQITLRKLFEDRRKVQAAADAAREKFQPYRAVLADYAAVNVEALSRPAEIKTSTINVAGVRLPFFEDVIFPQAAYSLFATPPWVDKTLSDMREMNRRLAEVEILVRQYQLLHKELTKIIQRVNLFEKIRIPQAREAIRVIRIHLGDEMTAAVCRSKIAKAKIEEDEPPALREEQETAGV